jgi:cytochrome oxidase assembly protein ShyY1
MVRQLLRPGWVLTHLAVGAIAVGLVSLGLWQLDRHAERGAEVARIAAVVQAPPAPLDRVLLEDDPYLRLAAVTGTYVPEGEVRLGPRSRNDLPGFEVLTPLRLPDGRTLVVDRGWVPLDEVPPPPPAGRVSATVRVREPGTARQVLRADDGSVELVSAVDLDVLREGLERPVTDAWVEVVDEEARAAGAIPRPAEPPRAPGSANHLSYAVQWFAFAAIGLVGYPLLLRRRLADARTRPADVPQ